MWIWLDTPHARGATRGYLQGPALGVAASDVRRRVLGVVGDDVLVLGHATTVQAILQHTKI
jgi:hypothetical protein